MSIRAISWRNHLRVSQTTIWSYDGDKWQKSHEHTEPGDDSVWASRYAGNSRILHYRLHETEDCMVIGCNGIEYSLSTRDVSYMYSERREIKYAVFGGQSCIITLYRERCMYVCHTLGSSTARKYVPCGVGIDYADVNLSAFDGEKMLVCASVDKYVTTDIPMQLVKIDPFASRPMLDYLSLKLRESSIYVYSQGESRIYHRDMRVDETSRIDVAMPPRIGATSYPQGCITGGGMILTRICNGNDSESIALSDLRYPSEYYELPPLPVSHVFVQMLPD